MDLKIQKWIKWIDNIKVEVRNILVKRQIFWEVNEIYKSNQELKPSDIYYQYLGDTYKAFVSMGIRRQLKIDKSSISLRRLLSEIQDRPKLLSRKYYISLYDAAAINDSKRANDFFSNLIDNKSSSFVPKEMVKEDIKKLRKTSLTIEAFGDKFIAHNDKKKPIKLPLFQEVDDCIDLIDGLCCKYLNLLKAEGNITLSPTIQNHWKNVFEIPWISTSIITESKI